MENKLNPFLARYKEKADLNQYWYSKPTIQFMVDQCQNNGTRIAFLSTPSVYFSLKDKELKANSVCFDVSTVSKDLECSGELSSPNFRF